MIGFSGRVSAATVWLMADMASGDGGFDSDDIDDCDVIDCGAFDSSTNFEDGTGLGRSMPSMNQWKILNWTLSLITIFSRFLIITLAFKTPTLYISIIS